jgi:hypothetical protein
MSWKTPIYTLSPLWHGRVDSTTTLGSGPELGNSQSVP